MKNKEFLEKLANILVRDGYAQETTIKLREIADNLNSLPPLKVLLIWMILMFASGFVGHKTAVYLHRRTPQVVHQCQPGAIHIIRGDSISLKYPDSTFTQGVKP